MCTGTGVGGKVVVEEGKLHVTDFAVGRCRQRAFHEKCEYMHSFKSSAKGVDLVKV